MDRVMNMQFIRYMNLFSRITKVSAKHCFLYNNMIVFVVPLNAVDRAIGKDNLNLKKMSNIIGKRIRVVSQPKSINDLNKFVSVIVYPIKFQNIELNKNSEDKEIIITAGGRENKAMLIGRMRARETELKDILEQYFAIKTLKIV